MQIKRRYALRTGTEAQPNQLSKLVFRLVAVCLVLTLAATSAGCGLKLSSLVPSGQDKLRVVATIYPLADFARLVGGNRVQVTQLLPQGVEPHDWEPSPKDLTTLYQAQVFIYNGAGLESWVDRIMPSLVERHLRVVKASEGLPIMSFTDEGRLGLTMFVGSSSEKSGSSTSPGSEKLSTDPHIWLNPVLAKAIVAHIGKELIAADPAGKSVYLRGVQQVQGRLDRLDRSYAAARFKSKDIVVSHAAFGYLAQRYGLHQVPVLGMTPEQEPDPATLGKLVDYCRSHQVNYIFFESMVSPRVADTIAQEVGVQTMLLTPLDGMTKEQAAQGQDYFGLMNQNLINLKKALGEQ
jgi:zinc transport system substrate-binding protein